MNMSNSHQQRTRRSSNLLITVKHKSDERSVMEIYTKPQIHHPTVFHQKTVYYNKNYRPMQQSTRPTLTKSRRHMPNNNRFYYYDQPHAPIRPLMEINPDCFSLYPHANSHIEYSTVKAREPKQRGQYRNRKAELDWDHGFDLDQVDQYEIPHDIDNHSLASLHSSSDNSFSSFQ